MERFGWEKSLNPIQSHPQIRDTSTVPAWPWALPGIQGQPQQIWEFQPSPCPPSQPGIPSQDPNLHFSYLEPFPGSCPSIPHVPSPSPALLQALSSPWSSPFPRRTFPADPWERQSQNFRAQHKSRTTPSLLSPQVPASIFPGFPIHMEKWKVLDSELSLVSAEPELKHRARIPAQRKRARNLHQHRILGLSRLENFGIIQSKLCPMPTLAPGATSRNSLETSRDGDSKAPWALPRPDHPFHEEIPADVQPAPPLAHPEAVPSYPVIPWDQISNPPPCQGVVESHKVPLEPPFLQELQEKAEADFSRYTEGSSKRKFQKENFLTCPYK
ncbi:uncharacterized protein LOC127059503 [Serinus canaria]|uniref:uncharacterized protein LOC127059503 n=1 Tax=Serinus canaria TaxID=9135 RepID=UPI0021CCB9D3|nr:uncharacterized protein LOC127059503 [Serinus canaria]